MNAIMMMNMKRMKKNLLKNPSINLKLKRRSQNRRKTSVCGKKKSKYTNED
jgi:hypothetical protein